MGSLPKAERFDGLAEPEAPTWLSNPDSRAVAGNDGGASTSTNHPVLPTAYYDVIDGSLQHRLPLHLSAGSVAWTGARSPATDVTSGPQRPDPQHGTCRLMTAICLIPPCSRAPCPVLTNPGHVRSKAQCRANLLLRTSAAPGALLGDARRVSLGEWPERKWLSAPGPFYGAETDTAVPAGSTPRSNRRCRGLRRLPRWRTASTLLGLPLLAPGATILDWKT